MNRKIMSIAAIFAFIGAGFIYAALFNAPQKTAQAEQFTTTLNENKTEITDTLKEQGFIKSKIGFRIATFGKEIKAGAYKLSKSSNVWETASVFKSGPYMKWVVIPEGYRKEQITEIIGRELDWNKEIKKQWIEKDTALKPEETEGVYFPETYLIPITEEPAKVAERLRAKFNEKFAPFAPEAAKQNIKWTTVIKLASIVQREAGKKDMPLVSGILWNRLLKGMKLDADATLQYIKGNGTEGWWPTVRPEDKNLKSPYNTYLHKGLPPGPIANPGLEAISSVIYPQKTKCFYYLHDGAGDIHCAETYAEHLKDIEKYLTNKIFKK